MAGTGGELKRERTSYGGWKNCVRLCNAEVDLVVTTDVGPRIIRYGFRGKENELYEFEGELGLTGGDSFRLYGGHRLWCSPEDEVLTYEPDNQPVAWGEIPGGIRTVQAVGPRSGVQKEMEISLGEEGSGVNLHHRLINKSRKPLELAAWSITVMARGGREVIPQTKRDTGLLPNRVIALWPYSSLDDPRVRWGEKYIILRQDPLLSKPFKIGISNEEGWAAYFNHDRLFVKCYTPIAGARYPDFGVSYETFTNDFMLELETLSPLTNLAPGGTVEHREKWALFDGIAPPPEKEAAIEVALAPFLRARNRQ